MKVYIGVCGIGLGHVSRVLEVASKLKENGCEILFSTYLDGAELLKSEEFKLTISPPFWYWVWPDGTVDPWRTLKWLSGKLLLNFLTQLKFEVKKIVEFKPDIIFSDSRLSPVFAGKLLGLKVLTMLNQFNTTIPGLIHYKFLPLLGKTFSSLIGLAWSLSDKIVIPDLPPPYTISALNLNIPKHLNSKVEYVGPILPVKPENLPEGDKIREMLGFDVKKPLIYATVSGPGWEKIWLGRKLVKIFQKFPEKYQVVVSLGLKNSSFSEFSGYNSGRVKVYGWLKERFEVLKTCDLVVCRAGHTTILQALSYGKPMILLPAPEQSEQIYNAKMALKLGIAKILDQKFLSKETLFSAVDEIVTDDGYLRRVKRLMHFSSKFNAVEKIIDMLMG
ncbi:MAG: hypothetical protein N3E48_00480 [Candidatus Bathyarchaeota archaeon]|nr:hypothetical protein [Candidatus Bathyarchaeota archaeon]